MNRSATARLVRSLRAVTRLSDSHWRVRIDEPPADDPRCAFNTTCPLRRHLQGPFCVYHSRGFEVRWSTIPGAGCGVFTTRALRKHARVGTYRGELLDDIEFCARYGTERAAYAWQTAYPDVFVDARNPASCIERYINDGSRTRRNNTYIHVDGAHVYVHASRDIEAGEELFCSYGDEYWTGNDLH